MDRRQPPLREVLDRLTRDFAEAVLALVRGATLEELVAFAAEKDTERARQQGARGMPSLRRVTAEARSRVRAKHESRTGRYSEPQGLAEGTTITDPGAMLAALESSAHRGAAPAAPESGEDLDAREADHPADEVPSEAPPLRRPTVLPAAREGEAVLRTHEGGVVVRRKRAGGGA